MPYAYPFLVGKNKHLGYGVIAAPDFMNDNQNTQSVLADETIGDIQDDVAHYREIETNRYGTLTLIYRHRIAVDSDNQFLPDESGRRITLTEGVVICESYPNLKASTLSFENVLNSLKPVFHAFYEHAIEHSTETTESILLRTGEPELKLIHQQPNKLKKKYDPVVPEKDSDISSRLSNINRGVAITLIICACLLAVLYFM